MFISYWYWCIEIWFSDCPKNFTNSSGTIMSPNYPDFYPKDYDCEWHITYAVGYQINLTFTYFDLVHTIKCTGDYVVLNGAIGDKEDSEQRHCGYIVRRDPLVSKLNTMVVKFHTDSSQVSRGFVLDYKVDGTGRLLKYCSSIHQYINTLICRHSTVYTTCLFHFLLSLLFYLHFMFVTWLDLTWLDLTDAFSI